MELHDGNAFKIKSYNFATQAIERHEHQLSQLSLADIYAIKGIGRSIGDIIEQLLQTQTAPILDELIAKTPEGILQMLSIKGIGSKKVKQLWEELGIESAGELLYACRENRLVSLKGFGVKTQENIQKSLEYILSNTGKYRYATLEGEALAIVKTFEAQPAIERISLTGAMRRKCEVVESIEIVVCTTTEELVSCCQALQMTVIEQNENAVKVLNTTGILVIFYIATPQNFVWCLFATTASPEHLAQLSVPIDEQGKADNELQIYARLKLPYILPEWREGRNEIALARQNKLPLDTIRTEDIRGVIHAHSTYSDGQHSLLQMAQACIDSGYEYLGISDHSKAAFYAGGLTEEQIEQQHREIDRLNEKLSPFRIFKGIEADILNTGDLDYNDTVLSTFDFVIASVHSNLKMTEEKAMFRLLRAIENRHTTILGHPTGRLILSRLGYPVDHLRLIDACAANGVCIELNASPYRLDIDWRWIDHCMKKNVPISINPDAHSMEGVNDIRYGVYAARKGMLTKSFTLNTLSKDEIAAYFIKKHA